MAAQAVQAEPAAAGPDPRHSPYATVRAVLGERSRLPDGRNIFGRLYP